jgi:mono/diheme cytochrome c family protein
MTKRQLIALLTLALLTLAPALYAADGAATFKAKCAMCHGPDGAGQTAMGKNLKLRDLRSAEVQKQTDAELVKWITDGKGKMPAYKGKLTPVEINAVVAFIRTLKK